MKRRQCSPGKDEIAREIIEYLRDHPDAGDTLEGIVQWWLLHQKIDREATLVAEVVSTLVRDGLLRVDSGQGAARPVYRLKRQNMNDH